MKISVEVLRLTRDSAFNDDMIFTIDETLTEVKPTLVKAKKRLDELKLKYPDCKIRIIENRNAESDKTRTACKILMVK